MEKKPTRTLVELSIHLNWAHRIERGLQMVTSITDEQLRAIFPVLQHTPRWRTWWGDGRSVVDAIVFMLYQQCSYEEVPVQVGDGRAAVCHYLEWQADGTWKLLCDILLATCSAADRAVWALILQRELVVPEIHHQAETDYSDAYIRARVSRTVRGLVAALSTIVSTVRRIRLVVEASPIEHNGNSTTSKPDRRIL
jgi:transposase